jgi:hypothetical protein
MTTNNSQGEDYDGSYNFQATYMRETSSRPSQMQVARPSQRHHDPARSNFAGRPSQMQVALSNQSSRGSSMQSDAYPSRTQQAGALPSIRESEPSRYGAPSQTSRRTQQVALPSQSSRGSGMQSNDYPSRTQQAGALPSIRESEPSRYGAPSQTSRRTQQVARPMQHTMYANRPQGMRTQLVNPGEPHHFGIRPDYERGELISTLCRCQNPDSHGDAFTMLDSPRGRDINGNPIDWQEVKKRMLDYHGKDQISHAEEVEAIPHVYDYVTAQKCLQNEEQLKLTIQGGGSVSVNIQENNARWHNDDGHAKPYLTKGGAKTIFTPGGH